jgi:N6-L-threonylcarbamoyladenine synthase
MDSFNLDFSFSGLKTAVLRYVKENQLDYPARNKGANDSSSSVAVHNLAASFQQQVIRSLLARLKEAVKRHRPRTVIVAGGVACNIALREAVSREDLGAPIYYPRPALTTDNAAMIAAAGFPKLERGEDHCSSLTASSSLKLENFTIEGYITPRKARYKI